VLVGAAIGAASARWVTFVGVPSFVVTLGLGLALNGIQLLLLPATARYGLMNTGIETIALSKVEGVWAWVAYAIFLAIAGVLIQSAEQQRRNVGLHVAMMTSVILPLGGSAIFGAIVVAILNSFQFKAFPSSLCSLSRC
jgi:D-xylose transport system permease protein